MMVQIFSILLVITSGVLSSVTQQVLSSTQPGQTLQIQPNVRKYNKHTSTESSTGTRKDKPETSDSQDYVPVGSAPGYPYPYPYSPYAYPALNPNGLVLPPAGNPYRFQYPYEPQYPVDAPPPYYAPYPAPAYYHPSPYPPQPLYDQPSVIDAYRSPFLGYPSAEQSQLFRQPVPPPLPYYYPSHPHVRAHSYNRPTAVPQQRDATEQYEQPQQSTSYENNQQQQQQQQFHY
ncbi:uncharacterized protein LOC126844381 isoform X2 [Adelges cooleyi]|uniref:uncharacterized protein LOC126844381 isoform X2 n=1 Tax=Adelges cooleyi TaxID=133065 RepID=UPI00217F62F5|nr:uncharacterized protein LOC126844381 isoform X2 [Adelges cooleyi]